MNGLKSWDEFAKPAETSTDKTGTRSKVTESAGGKTYECLATPHSLTNTPNDLVTMNPETSLWPGELLQGNPYKGGTLAEWPIRERASAKISIALAGGGPESTVEKPDKGSVGTTISKLLKESVDEKKHPFNKVSFNQTQAYSDTQVAASLGLSTKFPLGGVEGKLSAKHEANENSITASFQETAFTVGFSEPSTPSGFFDSTVNKAALENQQKLGRVGPTNIPVYVSKVTYGRILLFNATSTDTTNELRAAINGYYNGGVASVSADMSTDYKKVLKKSKISIKTLGSFTGNVQEMIKDGKLSETFSEKPELTGYVPISYTINSIHKNQPAGLTQTVEYTEKMCNQEKGKYRLTLKSIKINKIPDSRSWIGTGSLGNRIYGYVKLLGQQTRGKRLERTLFERGGNDTLTVSQGDMIPLKEGLSVEGDYTTDLSADETPMTIQFDIDAKAASGHWDIAYANENVMPQPGDFTAGKKIISEDKRLSEHGAVEVKWEIEKLS
ncbi:thiol-activated cytolysin family protein [Streptomyces olivoreticuli]